MSDIEAVGIIVTPEQINQRVAELASQINADYTGKTLDIICLVKSSSLFCADLVRRLTVQSHLHFLGFDSYQNANSSGEVRITLDLTEPLFGRHVLVVEGIIVSGRTPRYLLDVINARQPASLAICALGVKAEQLSMKLPLKYVGFELGAEIAVGYGIGAGVEKCLPSLVQKI